MKKREVNTERSPVGVSYPERRDRQLGSASDSDNWCSL